MFSVGIHNIINRRGSCKQTALSLSMILLSLLAICTIVLGTDSAICGDNVDADMSIMVTFDPWLIRTIGYECVNNTHFIGDEEYCESALGTVGLVHGTYACADGLSCFQCGDSGSGAAVCSNPDEPPKGCFQGKGGRNSKKLSSSFGCLVGDMMFMTGQIIGSIGFQCHDASLVEGQESFCGGDGEINTKRKNFTCPEEAPYCFQCGEVAYGAALCLSDSSFDEDGCVLGGTNLSTEPSDTDTGCLVGGVMYSVGQSIGSIGYLCHDDSVFYGQESFCGSDGKVFSKGQNFTCPEESPYCFQCGESRGAAICLSDASATRDGCKLGGSHSLTDPSATETGCLVGDVMFPAGQSTGSTGFFCFDKNYFYGQESFCGSDGIVYHQDKVLKCPEESPNCYQCGDAALGAAICLLDSTISPEGCSYGVSLVSAFNGTIGNSSNQTGFEFDVSTQTSLGNSTIASSNNSTNPNTTEAQQEDHGSNNIVAITSSDARSGDIRFPTFLAFFALVWNLLF